jgi:hypothetical protein
MTQSCHDGGRDPGSHRDGALLRPRRPDRAGRAIWCAALALQTYRFSRATQEPDCWFAGHDRVTGGHEHVRPTTQLPHPFPHLVCPTHGWGNLHEGVALYRRYRHTAGRVPVRGARVSGPGSLVGCMGRRGRTSEHRYRPTDRPRRIHAGNVATANRTTAYAAGLCDIRANMPHHLLRSRRV